MKHMYGKSGRHGSAKILSLLMMRHTPGEFLRVKKRLKDLLKKYCLGRRIRQDSQGKGIIRCFDLWQRRLRFRKKATEEALFPWIVSDFGLNDAIESGLVKTPRVVIRDDGNVDNNLRSRLYHIYMDETVKDDINRKAEDSEPLPDLIKNAYMLLGKDWKATKDYWEKAGQ